MQNTNITIQPAIINRETVQAMLGGISRTTFWRKRRYWEQKGTPFPSPAPGTNPGKGGSSIAIAMLCASSPRRGLLSRRMTEYGQQGDRALLAAHVNSCAGHRLQGRRLVYDLVPFQIREA